MVDYNKDLNYFLHATPATYKESKDKLEQQYKDGIIVSEAGLKLSEKMLDDMTDLYVQFNEYTQIDKDGKIIPPSKSWVEKFLSTHHVGSLSDLDSMYNKIINNPIVLDFMGFRNAEEVLGILEGYENVIMAYAGLPAGESHLGDSVWAKYPRNKHVGEGLTPQQLDSIASKIQQGALWYIPPEKPPPDTKPIRVTDPEAPPPETKYDYSHVKQRTFIDDWNDFWTTDNLEEKGKEVLRGLEHPFGVIDSIITGTEQEYADQLNDPNSAPDPLGIRKVIDDIKDPAKNIVGDIEDYLKDLIGIDPSYIVYGGIAIGGLMAANQVSGLIKNLRSYSFFCLI